MNVKIDVLGSLNIGKQLALLNLAPAKRRMILMGITREVRKASLRNLRDMKNVDGSSWAPRKRGSNRKLLRRIKRQINANYVTPDFGEVSFRGMVALQQHEGVTKVMNANAMAREHGNKERPDDEATRQQAKALRAEGYKIKVNKKWVAPSLSWITSNLTKRQAGIILRMMREQPAKKSWLTTVPGRTFLGARPEDFDKFVNDIFDNTMARV